MRFQFFIFYPFYVSLANFCPPIASPCVCSSSAYEPVSIRCSGASSLLDITRSLEGAKNSKIDNLVINGTAINALPSKALQGLNIVRLSLRKAGLTDLDPGTFDGQLLESIIELDLGENHFDRVPFNGVSSLKNLRKLNLSKNRIAVLRTDSFSSYESKEKLISLDLSLNKIELLDPLAVAPLRNLEEIDLQGNLLTAVPIVALRRMKPTLKNINLALNKISHVEPFTFDLPKLESLSLEYNDLVDLAPESLYGLPSLMYLYLTGNKLIRWESELFRSLGNLRNLGIGGTAITQIPWNAFAHIPHLLRLEMSDGVVNTVDCRAFRGARYLQAIILNNNKLTEIKEDTFRGLTGLYTLDISRNNIQKISDGAFAFLPNLRHLDLSGNQLQYLDQHMFDNTFQTSNDPKMLYLCRNPWTCNEKMDAFRRWLRENMEVVIDKPDCTSVCKEPEWLTNWSIRFPNPPSPSDLQYRHLQHRPNLDPKIHYKSQPSEFAINATPFRPPYVSSIENSSKMIIPMAPNTTTPPPTSKLFIAPVTPLPFLAMHGSLAVENQTQSAKFPSLDPTENMPSFAQVLLGKVSSPIMNVFRSVSIGPPRTSQEYSSRVTNSIFGIRNYAF